MAQTRNRRKDDTLGLVVFFFFNERATTEIYPLSLHDALPISCAACQKSKPMAPAFSEDGKAALPKCRGRHPHLRVAPLEECDAPSQPITLGATNMWFSRTLSALSIPSSADP